MCPYTRARYFCSHRLSYLVYLLHLRVVSNVKLFEYVGIQLESWNRVTHIGIQRETSSAATDTSDQQEARHPGTPTTTNARACLAATSYVICTVTFIYPILREGTKLSLLYPFSFNYCRSVNGQSKTAYRKGIVFFFLTKLNIRRLLYLPLCVLKYEDH